jgi:hypothetical protein
VEAGAVSSSSGRLKTANSESQQASSSAGTAGRRSRPLRPLLPHCPPRLPLAHRLPCALAKAARRGCLPIRRGSSPPRPPVAHDLSAPVPAYAQCARRCPEARAEPRHRPATPLQRPRLAAPAPPLLHLAWSSETKRRASRRPCRLVRHVRPAPPAVGSKARK